MRKLWFMCLPVLAVLLMAGLMSCSSENNENTEGEGPMLSRADLKPVVGHWNLVGYSSEGVFVSVEGRLGKEMFIDLEDDGKMSGTICNEFSGSFSCNEKGDFSFSEYGGTKMMSDDEDIVFVEDHLAKVNKYESVDGVLRLFFAGKGYVEFRK